MKTGVINTFVFLDDEYLMEGVPPRREEKANERVMCL